MCFERNELIQLRARAEKAANIPHLNPAWKRAYLRLADSLDTLDAMQARTMCYGTGEETPTEVIK